MRELDMICRHRRAGLVGLLAIALQAEGMPPSATPAGRCRSRPTAPSPRPASSSIDDKPCAPTWPPARWSSSPASRASTSDGNITTLGRGGSDTSAVAVAAAMKADECLIYTDVDGVYTTDPRVVPEARRLHTISFEEMLEMASLGSKVLQIRSVEFAGKYKVPLRVLSSFTPWDIDIDEEAKSRAP
jgi:aspartate kinase